MSRSFVPGDLLRYQAVSSLTASATRAACIVDAPGEASDGNTTKIWLVPYDGAAPSFFTSGPDSVPKWSPDGSRLAFVSGRGAGALQAYTIRADGGEAAAVTHLKGAVSAV